MEDNSSPLLLPQSRRRFLATVSAPVLAAAINLPGSKAAAQGYRGPLPEEEQRKVKRYLQAIFNQRIDGKSLDDIHAWGYDGIRVDAQQQRTAEDAALLAQDVLDHGMTPLVIVAEAWQVAALPAGAQVEVRNEPDIGTNEQLSVDRYMGIAFECINAARRREQDLGARMPVWIGAVSNLNERGIKYLDEMFRKYWRQIPDDVGVSVHRYPNGGYNESPWKPHDGFHTREHEAARLKDIIAHSPTQSFPYDRPFGVSEMGYHTGPRKSRTLFGEKTARWTDEDVYWNLRWEFNFWAEQKAAFLTVYQLTDGPTDDALGRYGIRRVDGTWKPSATIFQPPPRAVPR